MISFKEFIEKYNTGDIANDASWRAYAVEDMPVQGTLRAALKELRYRCGKETYLALSRVMSDYGIDTIERTRMLLELWYVWSSIANGKRTRKLKLRKKP